MVEFHDHSRHVMALVSVVLSPVRPPISDESLEILIRLRLVEVINGDLVATPRGHDWAVALVRRYPKDGISLLLN